MRLLPLAVAGTLVTCLAGCALPTERAAQQPAPATGTRHGGRITVALTQPPSLSPLEAYDPATRLVVRTMCDTLISLDPVTLEPKPGLARSFNLSPDGRTLTLRLRKGLRFTDGHPLTAQEVARSLSRLANAGNASYLRGLLSPVAGSKELADQLIRESDSKRLSGVQPLNTHDLQITLSSDVGGFVAALAEPATAPFRLAADGAVSCVGPYRLADGSHPGAPTLRLVRAAGYKGADVGFTRTSPYADEVDFAVYADEAAARRAYAKGLVDAVQVTTASSSPDLQAAPTPQLELVGLPDSLDGPFSDPDFRLALSEALDRRALVAKVWGGERSPVGGFLPPGLSLVRRTNACGDQAPLGGDRAAALASLGRSLARHPDLGPVATWQPVKLYVNDDYSYRAEAFEVARQWHAALGLPVQVVVLPWAAYLQRAQSGPGFDAPFRMAWSATAAAPVPQYSDPQPFLSNLFTVEGAASNWGHYADVRFDFLLRNEAAPEAVRAARRQQFERLEDRLCSQMPAIPVAAGRATWLVSTTRLGTARPAYLTANGELGVRELFVRSAG